MKKNLPIIYLVLLLTSCRVEYVFVCRDVTLDKLGDVKTKTEWRPFNPQSDTPITQVRKIRTK